MTFEALIKKAFFIFLFFGVIKAYAEEPNITVLMYHRVGEDKYPSTSISKELFEKHIETGSPLSCSPCLQLSSQGLEQTLPSISGKKLSLKLI